MAVTGVLVFKRNHENNETEAEIELLNPRIQSSVPIVDRNYPLAADFTAPLASYPRVSELWAGFVNMVRGAKTEKRSGLYMLEPYDPNRIPVVLVHGLLSSGYTWLSVGNEIQNDPQIRMRYQFWVFFYPTGKPDSVFRITTTRGSRFRTTAVWDEARRCSHRTQHGRHHFTAPGN
jgi:pimeloyl-ACP methyl ester carboxylesterase